MRITGTNRAACAAVAVAVSILALSSQLPAQGLMVSGYGDFEASVSQAGSGNGSDLAFDNHHFNLIFLGTITGDLSAAAEVEYEHAGDEIALEYGYVTYHGIPNVRITGGKFLVPFGRFNKDLHPTWINKMADSPLGFRNIMPVGYNDVGLWLSGGIPLTNDGATVSWDAFAVNGLMGEDGGGIRDFRDNIVDELDDGSTDNSKAVGGRLGLVLPNQHLDFGGSVYTGNYSNMPDMSLTLTMFDVDVHYANKGFSVRGEYVTADQEATLGDLTKKGGYAEAAYLVNNKWEPVVRYSMRDMPGESDDLSRFSLGMNYHISAAGTVRLDYHINSEETGFETDNNVLIAQFVTVF